MEDKTTTATTPPPAARTAQALRELHDRARTALAAQRERMAHLECQLTQQLDTIAETLADQIASQDLQPEKSERSRLEIEQLRQELEKARAGWNAEREQLAAEATGRAQLPEDRQADLDAEAAQLAASRSELDARQQVLDERAIDLNHQDRELRQRQELLDTYASQCAAQQSQLTATESALDKQRDVIEGREAAIESTQQQLVVDRAELIARETTLQDDLSAMLAERETLRAEREVLQTERAKLAADHAQLNAQRDELAGKLASLSHSNQTHDDVRASQLADLEHALEAERTAKERERTSLEEQRRLLAEERDELATALEAARNELAAARAQAGAAAERDELQQKFELALEDIQRLRGRVAALEQELASRPAPDQTDSVELVHLRAERDALAEQITDLERQSSATVDPDSAQELADLQRRFELAVEDVRDLKKKNNQLENQLAEAASHVDSVALSSGGSSWEAMKKQMLANLEGEGDDVDPDRPEERASIESTIRITDEALARKDREIAELKSRLATVASDDDEVRATEAVRQLIDADSVIAEHRTRIAQIEREMYEKLRTAELELSVERAKIAREKVQLADLKAEVDSQRSSGNVPSVGGGTGNGSQPRRRWLSKLGLTADDEPS